MFVFPRKGVLLLLSGIWTICVIQGGMSMRKMKAKGVPSNESAGLCSHYPLQDPCVRCGYRDQGPLVGQNGFCVLCSMVGEIQAHANKLHSPNSIATPAGGKGAVERPLPSAFPTERPDGWYVFVLYQLRTDPESGRVSAFPPS